MKTKRTQRDRVRKKEKKKKKKSLNFNFPPLFSSLLISSSSLTSWSRFSSGIRLTSPEQMWFIVACLSSSPPTSVLPQQYHLCLCYNIPLTTSTQTNRSIYTTHSMTCTETCTNILNFVSCKMQLQIAFQACVKPWKCHNMRIWEICEMKRGEM